MLAAMLRGTQPDTYMSALDPYRIAEQRAMLRGGAWCLRLAQPRETDMREGRPTGGV